MTNIYVRATTEHEKLTLMALGLNRMSSRYLQTCTLRLTNKFSKVVILENILRVCFGSITHMSPLANQ